MTTITIDDYFALPEGGRPSVSLNGTLVDNISKDPAHTNQVRWIVTAGGTVAAGKGGKFPLTIIEQQPEPEEQDDPPLPKEINDGSGVKLFSYSAQAELVDTEGALTVLMVHGEAMGACLHQLHDIKDALIAKGWTIPATPSVAGIATPPSTDSSGDSGTAHCTKIKVQSSKSGLPQLLFTCDGGKNYYETTKKDGAFADLLKKLDGAKRLKGMTFVPFTAADMVSGVEFGGEWTVTWKRVPSNKSPDGFVVVSKVENVT